MKKAWRVFPGGCDCCGGNAEILTYPWLPDGHGYDSDSIRCKDCGLTGHFTVDEDGSAFCNWDETESDVHERELYQEYLDNMDDD